MPLLFVTLWVIASSATFLGCGYVIMRLLRYDPQEPGARLVIGGSLGIALVVLWAAYIGLFLGWHPWLWIVILGAPSIATFGAKAAWNDLKSVGCSTREWWHKANYLERGLFVFGIGMFGIFLVQSTLPTTDGSDTRTYLYGAQLQLANNRLVIPEQDNYAQYGINRQILSMIGFYLLDFRFARAINIPFVILAIAGAAALSTRIIGRNAAIMLIPVFVSMPVVYLWTANGKIDHLMTVFVLATLVCIEYIAMRGRSVSVAIITGLLFGAALGTKPTALLFIPMIIYWFIIKYSTNSLTCRVRWTHALMFIVLFLVSTLVVNSGWILRGLFENRSIFSFISTGSIYLPALYCHIPSQIIRAISAPWILTFGPMRETTFIPPVFWILMVIGIGNGRVAGKWHFLIAGLVTIVSIAYLSASHIFFFSVRFMLPGFVLLTVISAAGLKNLVASRKKIVRWTLGLLVSMMIVIPTLRNNTIGIQSAKIALGIESPDAFLDKYVGPAEIIHWSRDHWTWQDTVWSANVIDLVYFPARIHYSTIGASTIGYHIGKAPDAAARCALMDSAHVKWALIGPPLTETGELGRSLAESCMDTAFVSSDGEYVVYRRRESDSYEQ